MLSACSALRVPQKSSRAVALCGFLLHHIFAVAGKLRFPLSQPQKRHIPRTLCAMLLTLMSEYYRNNIRRLYAMEYINSGYSADIYRDGSKVIKIFKEFKKTEVEYEANLQRMAFSKGLPVPEIYDIIEIDNKIGLVMEYIEGELLCKIIQKDSKNYEKYLTMSIELHNNIHKIESKIFPSMKERQKYHILHTNLISEEDKKNILLKIENTVYDNKLCHGDFHFRNLILTSDGLKIIDWQTASSGNPNADIYRTYLLYKLFAKNSADMILEKYCKILNKCKENILSWSSIVAGEGIEFTNDDNIVNKNIEIIKNGIKKQQHCT
jgi:thiamine kinase-like enzyme